MKTVTNNKEEEEDIMVGFKYLVADFIWSIKSPYGIDKKRIIKFMETIENVSYEKGVEHSLETILEDLVNNNLIAIHNDKIFVRMQEEKWKQYTEESDISMEESNITTVHEAIYDYNIADREFKEKMEKLKKYHKTDEEVLEAIIRKNFNISDETPISIGGETVRIPFRNKIEYNIFESLENTGLKYEVDYWEDYKMLLRIYLEPIE